MYVYHDWIYVNYILSLPYDEGLKKYALCIGRLNDIIKEKEDTRMWDLYLFDVQYNSFEGSFNDYKRNQELKQENKEMDKEDVKKEYDRISKGLDHIIQLEKRRKKKSG